ncbi:phosphoribosylformylglycinamidine synthase subunit PurQ [Chloracidobacterium sp. D]|jgi:phosphoribosylformylglycinamidine synthase I|uniref:phosphoribosylformylglycinamidine synthase subunit PurQ n=1 Tax=Chloracidobacterium sp. D TaxID=2821536 RepID=UPI001B8AFA5F|nr:phosphoribosylformylglycinamidine synthase subunit PurQ [Chloracidobacterium sp. D]QUV81847.1 phosphoribosylformylglycinamidine synthase subunit PurQ [Chloracidobacterium sp. D]
MKFGVVVFPGSNCDHDTYHVISKLIGQPVRFVWHAETSVADCDVVILPGGFSYGDYLRCGAIASCSPVMRAVREHAARGGYVVGICNGFQILCEAGLLPGVLLRNAGLRFCCDLVQVRVERADTPFTHTYAPGEVITLPIAHGEGNYYCAPEEVARLEAEGRVLFRYVDATGQPTPAANPNGSLHNIAGILNAEGNVLGLMPHPERACEEALGSSDGLRFFQALMLTLRDAEQQRRSAATVTVSG